MLPRGAGAFGGILLCQQCTLQPDKPHAEGIVQAVLLTLLDDLGGILGVDDLDQDLTRNVLALVVFDVGHDLKDQYALFVHVAIANGVSLADKGATFIFKILTAYYTCLA